jgi:hypothetical protein
MTSSLVRPLLDGPLDIVGDVHGEIEALRTLMRQLGYDSNGVHREGRRLVFVGDLTDRGPDSPAVVALVRTLVDGGQAQCVLGNHDLNILLDRPKNENRWFYGDAFLSEERPQRLADEPTRKQLLDFFAMLPVALERADLRVIHACWNDGMVSLARNASDVVQLYEDHAQRIESDMENRAELDETDRALRHQNQNPVKLLTSGPEERSDQFVAGDKSRRERRVPWWNGYHDTFCVFGHYSIPDGQTRGNGSSFCVDFGVGKRWTERRDGRTNGYWHKLAALRLPEKTVVFDAESRSK